MRHRGHPCVAAGVGYRKAAGGCGSGHHKALAQAFALQVLAPQYLLRDIRLRVLVGANIYAPARNTVVAVQICGILIGKCVIVGVAGIYASRTRIQMPVCLHYGNGIRAVCSRTRKVCRPYKTHIVLGIVRASVEAV